MAEHFDVLIVGAGLSGIGAGCHLQTEMSRQELRHPGRPRRDRRHLGPVPLSGHPLRQRHVHARLFLQAVDRGEGDRRRPAILNYVRETAAENGIDQQIRLPSPVKRAVWSTPDARWTVEAERTAGEGATETVRFTCNFLFMCAGYYNYEDGYTPEFPGAQISRASIVHPQNWPEDLDYAGKRVVVIGSGATAVTLVPAMAKTAAHVTMLQRSPTYVVSRPAQDPLANRLRAQAAGQARLPPDPLAQRAVRDVFLPALRGASRSG